MSAMPEDQIIPSIYSYNKRGEFAIVRHKVIRESKEFKIIECVRKNEQHLLIIALRLSVEIDKWFWLIPTELQLQILIECYEKIKNFYNIINGKTASTSLEFYM